MVTLCPRGPLERVRQRHVSCFSASQSFDLGTLVKRLLFATLLTAALGGCHSILGPTGEHELDDAWDHWLSLGITDYRYEVIRSCYCGGRSAGRGGDP